MPFDNNGNFNRAIPGGWQADAAAGTKITAIRHDAEDNGFAEGLSTCITRDGHTTILTDIPMSGKKIINHGTVTAGDAADTVATKGYVDTFKAFGTGLTITGAGPINGFINFASGVGVNGIGWATADMSWIGRARVVNQYNKRLAVNEAKDGTGSDVFAIDEQGRVNSNGQFANNLVWDEVAWRTPVAGFSTLLHLNAGVVNFYSNDTATAAAYLTPTLRAFATLENSAGTPVLTLDKSGGGKASRIEGSVAAKTRWRMDLGDGTAEGAERVGSNFLISSYSNDGLSATGALGINRLTNLVTTYGALTTGGALTVGGAISFATSLQAQGTTAILASAASGAVYLRPNGAASPTGETRVDAAGDIRVSNDAYVGEAGPSTFGLHAGAGLAGKNGNTGSYFTQWHNLYWDGTFEYVYVGASNIGKIAFQCDYRIKKNVQPLPSVWERVKALRPISFQQRAYDIWVENDTVRWGFVAHELQDTLDPSAASGTKDGPDIQSPDLLAILAGVTRALQEAMARIEALEMRALAT